MCNVMTYADALHLTMRESLNKSNVILLGQNINDHKGMFGTTLGLAEEFGKDVVIDTPICEESVTGLAIGAALNGLYFLPQRLSPQINDRRNIFGDQR